MMESNAGIENKLSKHFVKCGNERTGWVSDWHVNKTKHVVSVFICALAFHAFANLGADFYYVNYMKVFF